VWRHRTVDGREARSRHQIVVALGRLPRPLDQDADLTHVTGSALVLGPRGVLLHRHKRLGVWLQPGGHLEAGESPWAAARREAEEETGLHFRWSLVDVRGVPALAHVDVHAGAGGHTHLDLRYVLTVDGNDGPAPPKGESQEVKWFAWADAMAIADPGLSGFLRAHRGDR
jgi:8-oxo-dGTP pyrophosphatase MutT (NUDIX family)